jgi:hypothetical protein
MLNSREGVRVWAVSQKTCRICRKVVHDAPWIGHERQTNITGKECLHSSWRDAMGIYFNYINKRMKKIFTSIVLALCISVSVLAQTTTINVQGQQRKVNATVAARIQKAAKAVASTGIDFSKIERWAGEGDCKAALAIKWADGQNDGKTLVWGYRWNKGETKTGEDLIRAVVKADPALYMMATQASWGFYIGAFGYDADGDRYVTLTNMNGEIYPRNGVFDIPSSEFETTVSTKWGESDAWNTPCGMTDYWGYYTAEKASDAIVYSNVGTSGRNLTDGCVDAYVFISSSLENVYDGNLEYLPATVDYTKGVFVLNEGSYTHENASVNHLAADGSWSYYVAKEIGATGCCCTPWGNRYYIMAKQPKDSGAKVSGGRITICDANSMRIIKQIENIGENGGDGRSFCGVDEHKAYVSTSNGIYVFNLDNMEITGTVLTLDYGNGQCGNMVRLNDYVYAVECNKNIHIINCADNTIVKTIPAAGCGSIVMAKDGSLWVSKGDGIARIDTEKQELVDIKLADGIGTPSTSAANGSNAWNPDGFCASLQNNVLYWTYYDSVKYEAKKAYKYDIDNNTASLIIDLTDGRSFYATSALRVDPKTDCIYANLVNGWTYNDNVVRKYDANGKQLAEYTMKSNYWFPEVFVFPDTEDPIAGNIDAVNVEENKDAVVDLAKVCSDADNFQAAIVKTVKSVADNNVATATVKNGKLVVTGVKAGNTTVTLNFCSNGISTTATLNVTVTKATGITGTQTSADIREIARFTIDGKRINQPQRGINIVKYSDGTVKKVIVK